MGLGLNFLAPPPLQLVSQFYEIPSLTVVFRITKQLFLPTTCLFLIGLLFKMAP